jgi:hypothetical protein
MRQFMAFILIIYVVVAGFVGFGYYLNDSNKAYAQQEIWMDAASEGMTWPIYIWQFIRGQA